MSCEHEHFAANVDCARITDSSVWYADLRLQCTDCGQAMRFIGFPMGLSPGEPMTNVEGTELRIPFAPYDKGEARRRFLDMSPPGFRITSAERES